VLLTPSQREGPTKRYAFHVPASKVIAAYQRSDLFDPRRKLMSEWADFLHRPPAKVVALLSA
jgi:hypothetical protein